ncbi:MAG: aminotransferase class V-fold PLP-dependent enzyme [Candidatus Latescibacteria bacterium]|nr:aminotransferase class V-fold PLP-dependent enzyme [Candidatus Latescibacterota bacterium]NIM22338.1 aminotransferase class V-fold PLP-dependent enzyme [Candidatus Latescibacterota bacterium]NIM66168.1 aminotransferase class V-fold PLP-dependent enzyme [Candidatus Latescibacterota bacterium]NIO02576.1 aminotransferase class V-fold PLP-dependent enzyme [Candidatus Latescibacterota bacterium]NIO29490.1 aminotransferase class V-fold PLP-dependent enzyme [Candidatus Latescibacterota bacterium]
MGFSTDAVHGGQEAEPITGAVITPIFQTSTYKQDGLGRHKGYEYARTHNPTREAYERNIAVLERGKYAVAFASGMSAIDAVVRLFKEGDEIVVTDNVYGGTYRLFEQLLANAGLRFKFIDTAKPAEVEKAITGQTALLFIETPTNPTLKVTDIAAVSEIAHKRGIPVAVDNTFMSPYLQTPLELGADIVIHSATKYLNGHSDMVGGVVVLNDKSYMEKLRFIQNAVGAVPGPFDCWLALRGTKTLAVRMKQHEENARILAKYIAGHPRPQKVYYPGLPDHPQHVLQTNQARGFGGIISFDIGSLAEAEKVLGRVKLFMLAESLGGVESLISHPATMTHGSIPEQDRIKLGVTDGLVRLSVGIEDVEDLRADLEQALSF